MDSVHITTFSQSMSINTACDVVCLEVILMNCVYYLCWEVYWFSTNIEISCQHVLDNSLCAYVLGPVVMCVMLVVESCSLSYTDICLFRGQNWASESI